MPPRPPHTNACRWRMSSSVTCPVPGTRSSQDRQSPRHCRCPGKPPALPPWPLLVPPPQQDPSSAWCSTQKGARFPLTSSPLSRNMTVRGGSPCFVGANFAECSVWITDMVGPPGQGAAAPMGSQQGQCAQQPKGQNHISAGGLPVWSCSCAPQMCRGSLGVRNSTSGACVNRQGSDGPGRCLCYTPSLCSAPVPLLTL